MDVVHRVHVVPLGYEFDRIVEPLRAKRADLVYFLVDEREGDERPVYHEDLFAEVESIVEEVRTVPCDLRDVYAVLGEVTTLATKHREDNVYVNVSGDGTIAAIGATIACMDASTDAEAYYVEPAEFAHDGTTEPVSSGVASTSPLPTYPIDSPTRDQVAIMGFLADPTAYDEKFETTNPKKKDLIEYAEARELSFIADRSPASSKGKFRLLDQHVVSPLEADGYIRVNQVGRRHEVELLEQGYNAYRAFEHKLVE